MKKILPMIVIALMSFSMVAAQPQGTPKAGMTPDNPFYFLDSMFDGLQSAESRADEKTAEMAKMANESKVNAFEKAQKKREKAVEQLRKKADTNEEKAEQVAEQSTRHLGVLAKVYENAPEDAKKGLERAMNASSQSRTRSIQALNRFNETRGQQVDEKTRKQALENSRGKGREKVENLMQATGMIGKGDSHMRAMERSIECGLFSDTVTISYDVSEYTNKTSFTPEEALELTERIMTRAEDMGEGEEAKNTAELAKDIADRLSNQHGRGKGYWQNMQECPSNETGEDRGRADEASEDEAGMSEEAEKHVEAMERNSECGLLDTNMTIPYDVSEYTNKTSFTPEEAMELTERIMAHAEGTSDEQRAKNRAELVKNIADRVNSKYGKSTGYWGEETPCPPESMPGDDEQEPAGMNETQEGEEAPSTNMSGPEQPDSP